MGGRSAGAVERDVAATSPARIRLPLAGADGGEVSRVTGEVRLPQFPGQLPQASGPQALPPDGQQQSRASPASGPQQQVAASARAGVSIGGTPSQGATTTNRTGRAVQSNVVRVAFVRMLRS